MNPWLLLLFLAAAFVLCVGVSRWLLPTILSRGEVAGVPEVEDIPQAKSLDEFPAKRPCRVNAEPHWCADTSSDGEVIAAMEKQFPKNKTRRIR